MNPFIALTDKAWFDFLSSRATAGRVDEVNFWSPKSVQPLKRMTPGEPVFFRLKKPYYQIAGYGFFAHFSLLELRTAWELFGWKNGDHDEASFRQRLGRYRGTDLSDPRATGSPLACTVLRDARFWPESAWIPWQQGMGWAPNIVQGKSETDAARAALLLERVTHDAAFKQTHLEWSHSFHLAEVDARKFTPTEVARREGQGAFRARLLDAYGRRCAITGERTEPVLDAAHIQPYLGPQSNHPQNGLLLTKEFHTLFDQGFVTVSPDYKVLVSDDLRARWSNGKRYYEYAGQVLRSIPGQDALRPSQEALDWHRENRFRE